MFHSVRGEEWELAVTSAGDTLDESVALMYTTPRVHALKHQKNHEVEH